MSSKGRKRSATNSSVIPPSSKAPKSSANSSKGASSSASRNSLQAPVSNATLEQQLSLFTRDRLQKVLLKVAKENAIVAKAISEEVAEIRKAMSQAPAIDFQRFSSSIWHSLNIKYAKLRSSQQYEFGGSVAVEIEETISSEIVAKVTKDVCYQTKYNALVVLRKIAKSIMMCDEYEIGERVQNFGTLDVLVDGMKKIAEMMDAEERKKVMWSGDLIEKLEELDDEYSTNISGLPEILEMFGVERGSEDERSESYDVDEGDADERARLQSLTKASSKKPTVSQRKGNMYGRSPVQPLAKASSRQSMSSQRKKREIIDLS